MAIEPAGGVPSAVGIVVTPDRLGRPCFVLTRRSADLRRHAGQWALPGGRCDPGESAAEAAVRELGEELRVPAAEVEPVGMLDDYLTRSGYVITPVVLVARQWVRFDPNPLEVAVAYRVPLEVLVPILGEDGEEPTVRFRIRGRLVNPPTAAILHQFAELFLHGRHTAVGHFVQPRFTWS